MHYRVRNVSRKPDDFIILHIKNNLWGLGAELVYLRNPQQGTKLSVYWKTISVISNTFQRMRQLLSESPNSFSHTAIPRSKNACGSKQTQHNIQWKAQISLINYTAFNRFKQNVNSISNKVVNKETTILSEIGNYKKIEQELVAKTISAQIPTSLSRNSRTVITKTLHLQTIIQQTTSTVMKSPIFTNENWWTLFCRNFSIRGTWFSFNYKSFSLSPRI